MSEYHYQPVKINGRPVKGVSWGFGDIGEDFVVDLITGVGSENEQVIEDCYDRLPHHLQEAAHEAAHEARLESGMTQRWSPLKGFYFPPQY